MAKNELNLPVIEWSSSRVTAYDPQTRQYHTGANISEVASLLSGRTVVLALSRRSSFVRTLRVPDAPKEQVAQALKIQLPAILPIPAGQIAFDFGLSKNINEEGRLAIVAAVQVETLRQVHRDLKAAGLQAKCVVPTAFGSWLLCRSLDLDTCALVEHVSEGLAIDVIANEDLRYSRIVPFPKSSEGIDAEVCRTFSVAHVACSHIVAAGGLTFPNADTNVATRTLEVFGTGLASRLELNVELPETIALRQSKAARVKAWQAGIAWLAAAAVGALVFTARADAKAKIDAINAPYNTRVTQLNSKVATAKMQLSSETNLQNALLTAFQPAQSMADVVASLTAKVPTDSAWISGFTLERGKPLVIRGIALNSATVTNYEQALGADPRFRDVTLAFSNNGALEGTPIQEFSLQTHVMGNLPLSDPLKVGGQH